MQSFSKLALSGCLLASAIFVGTAHAYGYGTQDYPTVADIVIGASSYPGDVPECDENKFDYDILSTAVNAVLEAKPDSILADLANPEASLTLFAPNDLAFIRLAQDFTAEGGLLGFLGLTIEDEIGACEFWQVYFLQSPFGIDFFESVLSYHVVPERVSLVGFIRVVLREELLETLLPGASLEPFLFGLIDGAEEFENPRLFFPVNLRGSNGIIHTLSRVLVPPLS